MSRLFNGCHISSLRMQRRHSSHDSAYAECWIPKATFDHICAAHDSGLELLRILKDPKAYQKLKIATEKPKFFNDDQHWHITLDYHTKDNDLIEKIDAGNNICEVCKKENAELIDEITDINTMVKNEFIMCIACFDKYADSADAHD